MKPSSSDMIVRKSTLGNFLRKHRLQRGLTQKDVAEALGYSTAQFVSNWERGLSAPPVEALPTIVSLYRISPQKVVNAVHDYHVKLLELERKQLMSKLRKAR